MWRDHQRCAVVLGLSLTHGRIPCRDKQDDPEQLERGKEKE